MFKYKIKYRRADNLIVDFYCMSSCIQDAKEQLTKFWDSTSKYGRVISVRRTKWNRYCINLLFGLVRYFFYIAFVITCNHKAHNNTQRQYIVYENDNEFNATGIKLNTVENASENDYIRTDNGYYTPIVKINIMGKREGKKTYCKEVILPRRNITKFTVYVDTNIHRQKQIVWSREPHPKRAILTPKDKLIVKYMKSGMDIYQAYKLVYPGKAKHIMMANLIKLIENDNFIQYMAEEGIMKAARAKFESVDLSEDNLLLNLKASLIDPRMKPESKANLILKILDIIDQDETKEDITITRTLTMTDNTGKPQQLSAIEIVRQRLNAINESTVVPGILLEESLS